MSALEILLHACGRHGEDIVLRAELMTVERAVAVAVELRHLPAYARAEGQSRVGVLERIERDAVDRMRRRP